MAPALTDEWVTQHFDYLSEDLAPVLPETLARMRAQCPVAHSDAYGGYWIVTKYEDVLRVAQDWETFSSAHGLSVGGTGSSGVVRSLPVQVDPPEQRFFKKLINPFFTPKAIEPYEKPVRELCNRLIDAFIDDGTCDFMDAFARPFPSLTFFEQALGADPADLEHVAKMASVSSIPNHPESRECWMGLYQWVKALLEAREDGGTSRGDVVDAVLAAEKDGAPLPEADRIGIVQLLILGGLETTAGALGLMFHRFCAQPEIPALLRTRPDLIPRAVEELLRLDTSFLAVARTAMRDVELGGCPVKAGDKVLLYWASAGRDEDEFPNADTFDPERDRNPHFAFGAGPHRCAGSNLARLNLRIALEELLARLDDIRLADGADVHFHSTLTRAPLHLPITFTARTAEARSPAPGAGADSARSQAPGA